MKTISITGGGIECKDCGAVIARHWTAACPVKEGGYVCPLCYTKRMDADALKLAIDISHLSERDRAILAAIIEAMKRHA
jgi:hypothetical protein